MNNDIPVQSQTRGAHEASDEYAYEPTTDVNADVNLDSDPFADDLSKELSHAAPKTWANRTTLVIGGLVLIVGGFLGGIQVQKNYGTSSSGSATPSLAQLRSQFARGGAGGNAGSGFPGAGTGTTGTRGAATPQTGKVTLVDGSTIYVTLSDGTVLTVSTSSETQVSVATTSKVSALKKGQTVTIVGSTPDSTGKVTATSVTATR